MQQHISPRQLLLRLTAYFIALIGGILLVTIANPDSLVWLPFGGNDAIERAAFEISLFEPEDTAEPGISESRPIPADLAKKRWLVIVFLTVSLFMTILIILPLAWTYTATRHDTGFRKSFARALFVLPICATTIVLLIQDSLALAFGLAALVAAVRFRVALAEPLDGMYIFAAICVGLAGGIGYLGVAAIMAMFFCFTNTILWQLDYGRNPLDDARAEHAREKLQRKANVSKP